MLTITLNRHPATDLGYLLHKNPARIHEAELSFGKGFVVFPEVDDHRCTAVVWVDVDPIGLVRGKGQAQGSLTQYVNDRQYVASSFLSVALTKLFGTAMSGRCKDRPELVEMPLPLEIRIPVIASRAGEDAIRRLFEPLSYKVTIRAIPLDEAFPEWGPSPYFDVTLEGEVTLQNALRHLYLLLPALDARKHYFLDSEEVKKLLTKGEGWLQDHPAKEWIVRSYLGRKTSLIRTALEQLANAEPALEEQEIAVDAEVTAPEQEPVKKKTLHQQRHEEVFDLIRQLRPKSVVDLGCGEGKLLRKLITLQGLDRIVGMDVSYYDLEKAERKLHLETASPRLRGRIELIHGSLMYRDDRLNGFDVATAVEVIEHLDPARLAAFERVVFECARPGTVIVTTPNREYNVLYEGLEGMRHDDHRFEWTRAEFERWCARMAEEFDYRYQIQPIGEVHEEFGASSQMGVFKR